MAHPRFNDLTGRRFNRWLVIEQAPYEFTGVPPHQKKVVGQSRWKCKCDCGTIKERVLYGSLVRGASQSCGCMHWEQMRKPDEDKKTCHPLHATWVSMKTRCYNLNHPSSKHYGRRGIRVCKRWLDSFETFVEDMGPRPTPDHTLERKDNNGHYTPMNCKWADHDEQNSNKRSNRKVEWKGETRTLTQIARMENVDYPQLYFCFMANPPEDLPKIVVGLQAEGKPFHERAKGMGGSPAPRTSQKRTRRKIGGQFIHLLPEIVYSFPPDPLADIW